MICQILSDNIKFTRFADDTSETIKDNNFISFIINVNNTMEKKSTWAVANRSTKKVDKTESMLFSLRDYATTDSSLRLESNDNCYRDECKFLGVSLDNKLTFGGYVSSVLSKISKSEG